MKRSIVRWSVGLLGAIWSCVYAGTDSPDGKATSFAPRLTQYEHSARRIQDGQFSGPVSIAQTKDGYLWIGTQAGLLRFDGSRFVARNDITGEGGTAGRDVTALLAASDGALWIGGGREVVGWKAGNTVRHRVAGRVAQLAEDSTGAVWVGQTRTLGASPLCRVGDAQMKCFDAAEFPMGTVATLSPRIDGSLWAGNSGELCLWSPARSRPTSCLLQDRLKSSSGLIGVTALQPASDGTLWVGITRAGPGLGLGQVVDGNWKPFSTADLEGSSLPVTALLEDRDGALWVGTTDRGLYRIHRGQVEHFGASDGLSSDGVVSRGLFQDREGTVWVLTGAGIDSFRRLPVSVYSRREGLRADTVESVLPAKDGTVWLGSSTLTSLAGGRVPPAPREEVFKDYAAARVTSMLEDHAGRLWIGLDQTMNIFENGALREVTAPDGSSLGIVYRIVEDSEHDIWVSIVGPVVRNLRIRNVVGQERVVESNPLKRDARLESLVPDPLNGVWAGYRDGSIARYRGGVLEVTPPDAISSAVVTGLVAESSGTVLAATLQGLLVQKGSSRRLLRTAHGLPCERLQAVLKDKRNSVWLLADCGVLQLATAELERWMASPANKVRVKLFGVTEGVRPGTASFAPSAAIGPDGRLWFARGAVAHVIDLAAPVDPPPLSAVLIEEVTADRTVFQPATSLTLPKRTRDVDFRFTVPTSIAPQRVGFKYRLEGRDTEWTDAGSRRQAFYTDLPPGRYRFEVVAGRGGAWEDTVSSQAFEIPPDFYQTQWFLLVCASGLATFLYAAYVVRMRQVAANVQDRLAVKNAERERIARDLHDTLLQSTEGLILLVHGASRRLPAGDPTRDMLEEAVQRADDVLAEGRDRVQDLRTLNQPSDDLAQSLAAVGIELARDAPVRFDAVVEGEARPLRPDVSMEAYRIGREALLNAFRHANAGSIELQIIYGVSDLRLRVRDDGSGMDITSPEGGSRPGHWGLQGMGERATEIGAHLDLWSSPGGGTKIELVVPAAAAYAVRSRHFAWLRALRFAAD